MQCPSLHVLPAHCVLWWPCKLLMLVCGSLCKSSCIQQHVSQTSNIFETAPHTCICISDNKLSATEWKQAGLWCARPRIAAALHSHYIVKITKIKNSSNLFDNSSGSALLCLGDQRSRVSICGRAADRLCSAVLLNLPWKAMWIFRDAQWEDVWLSLMI